MFAKLTVMCLSCVTLETGTNKLACVLYVGSFAELTFKIHTFTLLIINVVLNQRFYRDSRNMATAVFSF